MTPKLLSVCLMVSAAMLASAAPAPETASTVEMPARWQFTEAIQQQLPSDDAWWRGFQDPVLDSLISMGIDANYDVAIAMRRMDAASRQIAIAKASYYPSVDVNAGYTRSRTSGADLNTYSLGATANWEIDLFGKITAQVKQKKAAFRASRAQWVGTMVSMAAQIANTYTDLREWQSELLVAREQSVAQDSILQLVKARYEAGLEARMQVSQAAALTANTNAGIPALLTSIETAQNALALLVGRYPEEIRYMLDIPTPLPDYRRIISTGVPGDLLRRRPDIVEAEANLASAAASLGIAKKDFLPTLSISGSIGVGGNRPGDMFTRDGFTYSVGPTLSWTVFDGMARKASVAAARDEMEAQIASYNQTVMGAYNEVDNAVTNYVNCLRAIADYESATRNAGEFLNSSVELYTQGLLSYSDVATAQKTYLSYSNSVISSRANAVSALIALYKALGGGFE